MAIRLASRQFEYTLEADRKSEIPSVFVIRELNHAERARIADLMPDDDMGARGYDHAMTEVCRIGLIEVRNCMLGGDKIGTLPAADLLDGLRDVAAVTELAMAVMRLNVLSDSDKKKSRSPSQQKGKG